jgi:hypothetical protein
MVISFSIFIFGANIHFFLVRLWDMCPGEIVSGFLMAIVFYISREIRDREKLGHWDLPGLLWPTIGCILLFTVLVAVSKAWASKAQRVQEGTIESPSLASGLAI